MDKYGFHFVNYLVCEFMMNNLVTDGSEPVQRPVVQLVSGVFAGGDLLKYLKSK